MSAPDLTDRKPSQDLARLAHRGRCPHMQAVTEAAQSCGPRAPIAAATKSAVVSLGNLVKVHEEGNYKVTVMLGDPAADATTTVKAELRRLMLQQIHTPAGQFVTRSFIVNVRRPEIAGGAIVKLKTREKQSEAWAWDDRITLEFIGDHPSAATVKIEKAANIPTIYIAGDSTSTDQPSEPFNSWGQMLTRFFKPDIAIANHGESGESLRAFIAENRFAKLMTLIRRGDWLFIKPFGNDKTVLRGG